MKPNWSFAFGMAFVLLCGWIGGYFAPEPLIQYPEHAEVLTVYYGGEQLKGPFDGQALMEELGAASGYRRSETFAGYLQKDVVLEFHILDHKKGKPRQIMLGNINVCSETPYQSWDIIDAGNLYNRLIKILGITSEE